MYRGACVSLLGVPWEGTEEQRLRKRAACRLRGLLTGVGRVIGDATSALRTMPGESSPHDSSSQSEAKLASVGVTRDQGKTPQRRRKFKLHRWQTLWAAIITTIATVVVALVTTHARSTSGGPPERAVHPPVRLVPPVAIASFSDSPLPPPPGESFLFQGTVLPGMTTEEGGKIYIIVRRTSVTASSAGTQPWLVSPPAHVFDGTKWSIKWDLTNPPAHAQWSAVLMVNGLFASQGTCEETTCQPLLSSFRSQLRESGPSAPEALGRSAPVRIP
jgi:hypothetical protein